MPSSAPYDMEQQVLDLLRGTLVSDTSTVRDSGAAIFRLYSQSELPFSLLLIASHAEIDLALRKAALTTLKNYVNAAWSADLGDSFQGQVYLTEEAKGKVREQLLALCMTEEIDTSLDQNVQALAAGVTSKIASVDFPDAWPNLFEYLVSILTGQCSDAQMLGALRLLSEVVDSGFDERQFFAIAHDLTDSLHQIAMATARPSKVRAMAVSVFRGCFGFIEIAENDQMEGVKNIIRPWMPLLVDILHAQMPQQPSGEDEVENSAVVAQWRGSTSLKIQAVMVRGVGYKKISSPC